MDDPSGIDWRQVLELAAADPTVTEHHGALLEVLAAALAGTVTLEQVTALFEDEYLVHLRFLIAIDAAFERLNGDALAAAQATLSTLPLIVEELVAMKLGYPLRPEAVAEFLGMLPQAFERARQAEVAADAALQCPRCEATDVRTQFIGSDTNAEYVVATCRLCGATAEWASADPSPAWAAAR
jgi:hypothetical protein